MDAIIISLPRYCRRSGSSCTGRHATRPASTKFFLSACRQAACPQHGVKPSCASRLVRRAHAGSFFPGSNCLRAPRAGAVQSIVEGGKNADRDGPRKCRVTDDKLLAEYRTSRTEKAFAEIVARHGTMVLRTCLRLVGNLHEAEDAAQAVFMVFVQRAHVVKPPL